MKVTTESGFNLSIPRSFGHYIINKNLISGSTCSMALATDTNTNDFVAVKIMSKKDSNAAIKIDKEINILTKIKNQNPNIIQIIDVLEVDDLVFVVMEYCPNGDLYDAITAGSLRTVSIKKRVMKGILSAVSFLHNECGIAHGDIKAENIALDSNFEPKLIDFGNAKNFEIGDDSEKDGTLLYACPELLTEGSLFDTKKADIYALGILMTTLFTGHFPFYSLSDESVIEQILSHNFSFPNSMNLNLKAIMVKCTQFDPSNRPNINEILNYPWFNTTPSIQVQKVVTHDLKTEKNSQNQNTEIRG